MDTIFMNSKYGKTSEPPSELTAKLDLRRSKSVLLYQTLVFITHEKT